MESGDNSTHPPTAPEPPAPEPAAPDSTVPEPALRDILLGQDQAALNRLLSIYRPLLTGFAGQLVPPALAGRVDRSDLVQEALTRGLVQRTQFRGESNAEFSAWLKQILQNVATDWIRRHTSEKRDVLRETGDIELLVAGGDSPSTFCSQQEEFERIALAMEELTEEQRVAVRLRSEGFSFPDIGERLNRSEDAARMLWGRGLSRLMERLKHHDEPDRSG